MTCVASGLYHDYVWYVIFYDRRSLFEEDDGAACERCYDHTFGKVTAFFLYVGIILVLERPVGKLPFFQWLGKTLPKPVIAHLLVLIHLPFAHWYVGDWIVGKYFDDFSIALWHVRQVAGQQIQEEVQRGPWWRR